MMMRVAVGGVSPQRERERAVALHQCGVRPIQWPHCSRDTKVSPTQDAQLTTSTWRGEKHQQNFYNLNVILPTVGRNFKVLKLIKN